MKNLKFYVTFLFMLFVLGCEKDELIDIEEQQIETETDKHSANKQAPINEPAPTPGGEEDPDDSPPGTIDNPIQLEAVEVVHTVTTYILISFSTERSMNIRDLVFTESDLPGVDLGQFSGGVSPLVEALLEEAAENALLELEEWEEQIDDTNLRQCLRSILNNMTSLQNGVGFILRSFAGNTPGYNWEVQDGILSGETASTDPPANYNSSTGTITTTFDSQAWQDATDLSWARTILHESIHAYLASYYKINRPNWIATYPQMVQDWGTLQNWNDVHHEEIARSLVNSVALALEEYGQNQGYTLSRQFYEDMAWGGLQGTSAFINLSQNDKTRILNVIAVELTGKDINNNSRTQRGTNAGC